MKTFPHHYQVVATGRPDGEVVLSSVGLEALYTAPPVEFDGPGDRWSPESLLVGAIADCFTLTFRAVARGARLPWVALHVEVVGTLEREQGNSRFTNFAVKARLQVPTGCDLEMAERALHKAEAGCLISNSLSGQRHLTVHVEGVDSVVALHALASAS
jgi:organic hydroperoxide reductase OsmC/OhrA